MAVKRESAPDHEAVAQDEVAPAATVPPDRGRKRRYAFARGEPPAWPLIWKKAELNGLATPAWTRENGVPEMLAFPDPDD